MSDVSKITDPESVARWLNGSQHSTRRSRAVFIASRAATRVAPLLWTGIHRSDKRKLNSIKVWRHYPISHLYGVLPTLESTYNVGPSAAFRDAAGPDVTDYTSCAAAAGYAVWYRDLAHAAASAVQAAMAAVDFYQEADADVIGSVRRDIEYLGNGGDAGAIITLWPDGSDPFAKEWKEAKANLIDFEGLVNWQFWFDWYEFTLKGKPMLSHEAAHWEMLAHIFGGRRFMAKRIISLFVPPQLPVITEADWDKGDYHVNPKIRRIYETYLERYPVAADPEKVDLFIATLFDFTYDKIEAVMRAVPVESDWKTLADKGRLNAFLEDAADLRDDLILMCSALEAEGASMQGGAGVRTYAAAILSLLSTAEEIEELRVDKLMEYGRILDAAAHNEDTLREFGTVGEALIINAEKLRELVRNHFAHTLARMAILRDIHLEPDASPWQVLKEFRGIVEQVQSGGKGKLPPLAAQDAAILTDVLDSVDVLIRSMETAQSEDARSSFQKDIDLQLAKVGATAGVYKEKASRAISRTGDAADTAIKWNKRWDGLRAFGRAVRDLFESGAGS